MKKTDKKKREKYYSVLFRDLFKKKLGEEFPTSKVIDDRERPDFLVEQPQGFLGIEITELVREKHPNQKYSDAEKAGFNNKIVVESRRLCEEWGVPPLWVTIWIIGSLDNMRGNVAQRKFSEKLAKFVKEWCDKYPKKREDFLDPADEIPEIWRIQIVRLEDSLHTRWEWDPGAVCVSPVNVNSLLARIKEKDKDYDEYRKCCGECWLIIIGDPCDPAKASDINMDKRVKTYNYQSRFDRVFFLQLLDELMELNLIQKSSG